MRLIQRIHLALQRTNMATKKVQKTGPFEVGERIMILADKEACAQNTSVTPGWSWLEREALRCGTYGTVAQLYQTPNHVSFGYYIRFDDGVQESYCQKNVVVKMKEKTVLCTSGGDDLADGASKKAPAPPGEGPPVKMGKYTPPADGEPDVIIPALEAEATSFSCILPRYYDTSMSSLKVQIGDTSYDAPLPTDGSCRPWLVARWHLVKKGDTGEYTLECGGIFSQSTGRPPAKRHGVWRHLTEENPSPYLTPKRWHTLTAVVTEGSKMSLYVDGTLTKGGENLLEPDLGLGQRLSIFGGGKQAEARGGVIRRLRITDGALTPSEILEQHMVLLSSNPLYADSALKVCSVVRGYIGRRRAHTRRVELGLEAPPMVLEGCNIAAACASFDLTNSGNITFRKFKMVVKLVNDKCLAGEGTAVEKIIAQWITNSFEKLEKRNGAPDLDEDMSYEEFFEGMYDNPKLKDLPDDELYDYLEEQMPLPGSDSESDSD